MDGLDFCQNSQISFFLATFRTFWSSLDLTGLFQKSEIVTFFTLLLSNFMQKNQKKLIVNSEILHCE